MNLAFSHWQSAPFPRVVLPSALKCYRVGRIQAAVAAAYQIKLSDMTSADRKRRTAWPRQVAMYLARDMLGKQLTDIGRYFGDRDHSTVIFAIKAVKQRMAADPLYRADVEALREALS